MAILKLPIPNVTTLIPKSAILDLTNEPSLPHTLGLHVDGKEHPQYGTPSVIKNKRLSPLSTKSPSLSALSYSVTAICNADNVSVHRPLCLVFQIQWKLFSKFISSNYEINKELIPW